MNEKQLALHQKYARLMGIMYGVIIQCEDKGVPVTRDTIFATMSQHASEQDLIATINELNRYADITKGF